MDAWGEDPFCQRFLAHKCTFQDIRLGWQAEAVKRFICYWIKDKDLGQEWLKEPTWFWTLNMWHEWTGVWKKLDDSPSDYPLVVHPGIGVGIHVFGTNFYPKIESWLKQEMGEDYMEHTYLNIGRLHENGKWEYTTWNWCWDGLGRPIKGIKQGHVSIDSDITAAAALTTLLKQKIVHVDRGRSPRNIRRETLIHTGFTDMEHTKVSTVTWRKKSDKLSSSGEATEWDKHWWVTGHFRKQPYPSEGVSRLIFIDPHAKGNLSAPLYNPPRVNLVKR